VCTSPRGGVCSWFVLTQHASTLPISVRSRNDRRLQCNAAVRSPFQGRKWNAGAFALHIVAIHIGDVVVPQL
jgi:hypothetical protein